MATPHILQFSGPSLSVNIAHFAGAVGTPWPLCSIKEAHTRSLGGNVIGSLEKWAALPENGIATAGGKRMAGWWRNDWFSSSLSSRRGSH